MAEEDQMGQLVLIFGDFHIPQRCAEIPAKYREMITPNKVSAVFCMGNAGSREVYDWIKTLAPAVHMVKGDYEDEGFADLPEEKVVEFCGVKIGLFHGHQLIPWADQEALQNKAKELGVSLLISGHTHQMKFTKHNHTYFANPGSMTGAYSTMTLNAVPSFMILEFRSTEIVVYEYSMADGELKCVDSKVPKSAN